MAAPASLAPASPATGLAARIRALATNPAHSAWSWGCAVVVSAFFALAALANDRVVEATGATQGPAGMLVVALCAVVLLVLAERAFAIAFDRADAAASRAAEKSDPVPDVAPGAGAAPGTGVDAKPAIMIPLVAFSEELKHLRWMCEDDIKAVSEEYGVKLEIPIGTMIELPRAAITADHIAKYADFYSFGTNDLTQTCLGFSRDDVESSFLDTYMNEKLIKTNPFATLDRGVARLVQMGVEGGKATNPDIVCGVCGETGGDPDSIQKYYDLGLDYVSCSPFRVPIARLAAAQAKIKSNGGAAKLA